jgi:RecA/RadA recombinase
MKEVDKIKAELSRKVPPISVAADNLLSTGSTLLNLACTGHWQGGFAKGMYFLLVGDSRSGKTFVSRTCLAEAARNPNFSDYRFIFDDVEGGALMDVERFFGKKMAERLEPPAKNEDGSPHYSETIEDFYFNLDDALGHGSPCIYILDSTDALSSNAEVKKFAEKKKASRKGTETSGDYGDGKARVNSRMIRSVLAKLRDTGSILIVINQTRANVGASMFEPQKIRSGGNALTFYATVEAWLSCGPPIKKTKFEKERVVGLQSRIAIKKNRFTGKTRTVSVPINTEFGIDDIKGCIEYLLSESKASGWKKTGQKINTVGFGVLTEAKLIEKVQEEGLEEKLSAIVGKTWTKIEEACAEERKPRYE